MTIPEAAGFLKIKRQAVYQAIQQGRLPARFILGKLAVKRDDVKAYQPRAYGDRPGRRVGGRKPKEKIGE